MEGLGHQLQQARLARGLTLDEAGRLTKIRPGRLAEIEAEDFSNFASLAYAKGFVQIYGKFLDVDVTPHLETFETSNEVTVDGYSYLQDTPAPRPSRPITVPRAPREHGSLLPFIIGVVVLVLGFTGLKFFLDVQRIKPRTVGVASPTPAPATTGLVAPRALPVEKTPAPVAAASVAPKTTAPPVTRTTPAVSTPVAAASAPPVAATAEPEVRRAEPVRADDLAAATGSASPAKSSAVNRIEIRPLHKTYLKVVVDGNSDTPAIERWISSGDGPLKVSGQRVAIRVLDPSAVDIRKNGKHLADDDPDVTVE